MSKSSMVSSTKEGKEGKKIKEKFIPAHETSDHFMPFHPYRTRHAVKMIHETSC